MAACAAALALGTAGCSHFGPDEEAAFDDEPSGFEQFVDALNPFPSPIVYEIVFEGLDGAPELQPILERASEIVARQRRDAPEEIVLRRRAAADVDRLVRALRSEGYFEAEAESRISQGEELPTVVFSVSLGRRFTIEAHEIVAEDGDGAPLQLADYALAEGSPAVSGFILAAEERAVAALQASGRAYAAVASRDAVADLEAGTLRVESRLRIGPMVRIGAVEIEGADSVEEDYVRGFVGELVGQPASPAALAERERALRATGLFRAVRVSLPEEPPAADGPQPVTIAVDEAAHRTIGAGLRYDTADGPGARAFWEHRNLLGRAETFRIEIVAAFAEQGVEITFRKPRFLAPQRALLAAIAAERETNDAYERIGLAGSIGLEEQFSEEVVGVARIVVEISEIDDDGDQETSLLVGLPLSLRIDEANDPIDPTGGYRVRLTTAPYVGEFGESAVAFLSNEAAVATYYALDAEGDVVAAGRARVAVIAGSSLEDVPSNYRLYGGGGGSVRAFATRRVGPLDDDGDPTGGLTAADLGLELRFRVSDEISLAPFFDVGFVNADAFDFDAADLQAGPGLGVRLLSPIGVVRGDIATPIDPREDDQLIQVYISIGQEF